jgi:hypothetical protein
VSAEQAGVFTREQALAEGWTPRQVHLLVGRGDWVRAAGVALIARVALKDGVVPTGGVAAPDAAALAWSAALTWPWAVTSHLTAAGLHGFPVQGDDVGEVTSTRNSRRAYRLRAHQAPLADDEVTTLGGLVLTTPERSAVDCLATLPLDDALDLWAWLSTRRVLTRPQLAEATRQRVGRHGVRRLVRLLGLTRSGAVSHAERRLHALLRTACIRGWRAGRRCATGRRSSAWWTCCSSGSVS